MIYVTHDQVEAMTMADKIVVLHGGIIEQVGSPLELYHRPNNLFVAGFIGSPKMNFIPATVASVRGKTVTLTLPGDHKVAVPLTGDVPSVGSKLTLGVRPEHVELGGKAAGTVKAKVRAAEYLGSETMFYGTLADGSDISVKAGGLAKEKSGDTLNLVLPPPACHLFNAEGKTIHNGDLTK
jgi:multiple sugar transport system ATP-binding protein